MEVRHLDNEAAVKLLGANPLFAGIGEESLNWVAQFLESVHFTKGEPIVIENEPSDHVYFIQSGAVEVVKHLPELKQVNRLAILRQGSHFSEFSVLNKVLKTASVFAYEDCDLLRISGDRFLDVLAQLPQVTTTLVHQLADMTSFAQTTRGGVEYYNPDWIELNDFIPQIFPMKMWARLNAIPLKMAHQSLYIAVKNPSQLELFSFFRQSQPNLQLYLSLISDTDFERLSQELTAAYTGGKSSKFPQSVKVKPGPGVASPDELVKITSIFRDFPPETHQQIIPHFETVTHPAGTRIYKTGDKSDVLYVIMSGAVDIYLPLKQDNAALFISTLGEGDYFSEISLLNDRPHGLTARAATPVKLAVMKKSVFEHLMQSPLFSLPLSKDLALRFREINSKLALKNFNHKEGVQADTLADLIPRSIIEEHQILPLRLKENELIVGTVTRDCDAIYPILGRYLFNYRVSLEMIQLSDFKRWVAMLKVDPSTAAAAANAVDDDAVALLQNIMQTGFKARASDVYIEPSRSCYTVRMRVDGVIREYPEKVPHGTGAHVVNRIKVLGELDTTKKFIPQDGQFRANHDEGSGFVRVSTMPTKHGENAVLRLIRERNSVPPVTSLAPDRRSVGMLGRVAKARQGVFLVTGPTGSGKSTTLYSLLKEINRVDVNVITVEDPVEMEIAGANQIEINEKAGLTFHSVLRGVLRQAPDIIMIGEIRDNESAKVAFHAAMTGHLVISTLHTNNSLEVVPRLLEMGVQPSVLAAGLIGASAQRLLRQVCMKCREMRPITAEERELFLTHLPDLAPPEELAHAKGCAHCEQKGYFERFPLIEIWEATAETKRLVARQAPSSEFIPELRKQNFETLTEFGLRMVANKLSTLEELQRVLGPLLFEEEEAVPLPDQQAS